MAGDTRSRSLFEAYNHDTTRQKETPSLFETRRFYHNEGSDKQFPLGITFTLDDYLVFSNFYLDTALEFFPTQV
jgi:hypothetical protein